MSKVKTIGFPRMIKEKGEKRDFLPELFSWLNKYNEVDVYLEKGYGQGMGFTHEDYIKANPNIKFISHEEIYKKDLVVVLKSPTDEEIKLMGKGSHLVSMLHYPTRKIKNKLLLHQGINCYSMDSMVDDDGVRMLVNYKGTSRSAVKAGFYELKKRMPKFMSKERGPIKVTIIGMGFVAQQAAKALEEFSDIEFLEKEIPGVVVRMLPRTITNHYNLLEEIMKNTDLLIDASKRLDTTKYIVSNKLIGYLPQSAVILDISADPYNDKLNPVQVKAIEGIPTGNLEKYIFETDDISYEGIPKAVDTTNRRVVVSCSAWPGVDPKDCMKVYDKQIKGFLDVLLKKDLDCLDINSENAFERSLYRSTLKYYQGNKEDK